MELISTRPSATQVALTANQQAVVVRYGDKHAMLNRFVPAKLIEIYKALDKSVDLDAPSMVNVIKAYGEQSMAVLIGLHVHKLMMFCGIDADKIDNDAVKEIATNIILNKDFRLLNIAFALSFFQEVQMGKYKLYACKPNDIMTALDAYCKDASARQYELVKAKQKREREEQEKSDREKATTWTQYCEQRGFDPKVTPNPLNYGKR